MSTPIYEPSRVIDWLFSVLNPLASGGAWHGVAAEGAVPPFIVYSHAGGADVAGVAGIRLWNSGLYLVKVTGPINGTNGTYAALVSIADAIDAALQLAGRVTIGANSDGYLMRCVRETVVPLPNETVNGDEWASLGALWRIQARKNA